MLLASGFASPSSRSARLGPARRGGACAHGHPHGDQAALILGLGLGTVLAIVAIASALVGVLGIFAGIGVWRNERWGDVVAVLVSALHIFNPPIGTALACYTGWVVLVQEPAAPRALARPFEAT